MSDYEHEMDDMDGDDIMDEGADFNSCKSGTSETQLTELPESESEREMVVIEPEPREGEEKGRVNVTREPKSKPSAKTTSVEAEPSHSAKSGAVDVDDGFETASESDFNGGDDDHDPEQNQKQEEPPQPMAPIDDSLEAVSDEESIQVLSLPLS
ncbi:hypothetical protein RHSIM_Rhsim03G0261400 [Rhododendron simsii]|uniref:Uncharacterized protein n=1 Tax=Rhododendron simsii TaxID=118357 RepID=A0A834H8B3_RHOSS|nr:hypothetical protein RHSIM_Rhsim03G0261400 [Rhododendron simsii]